MTGLINRMKAQVAAISADIDKVGNKAARARVRKGTLMLGKLGKEYRKESIGGDRIPVREHGRPVRSRRPASADSFRALSPPALPE